MAVYRAERRRDWVPAEVKELKPVFLPLKREHYEAFEGGYKDIERRIYGKRWNGEYCVPGRRVTLSMGYGKKRRLQGTIREWTVREARFLDAKTKIALVDCYGYLPEAIIEIGIMVHRRSTDG
jgi:hypothetical protein